MTQKTRIVHDDPLIFEAVLDFIPAIACLVGDILEYESFVPTQSLSRYSQLKAENAVQVIVEREVILTPDGETLVLYVTTKPAE